MPRGRQTLANVPFQIGGLIQLWGEGPAGIGRNYRETVEGIPVRGKFQAIYVLHGSSFTTVTGTPIAGLVFHYADGSSWTNLIRYGTDSRDWWEPLAENLPPPTNSVSKVIWRGDCNLQPDFASFGSTITNPETRIRGQKTSICVYNRATCSAGDDHRFGSFEDQSA